MLSKRFPFGIYYEVEDEVVYVYAILDLRRDPLWVRKQLRQRRYNSLRYVSELSEYVRPDDEMKERAWPWMDR
jgi:hypothetical protein